MGVGGGEDLGDQFSLILTPARPDTQAKRWPGGRKGKERRSGEGEETGAALLINLLLLRPARRHHSISFLAPSPEEAAAEEKLLLARESGRLPRFWSKKTKSFFRRGRLCFQRLAAMFMAAGTLARRRET